MFSVFRKIGVDLWVLPNKIATCWNITLVVVLGLILKTNVPQDRFFANLTTSLDSRLASWCWSAMSGVKIVFLFLSIVDS